MSDLMANERLPIVEMLRDYSVREKPLRNEAADTIERLVESLEPFADNAEYVDALGYDDSDYVDRPPFKAGDFRRAAKALAELRNA